MCNVLAGVMIEKLRGSVVKGNFSLMSLVVVRLCLRERERQSVCVGARKG